MSIKALLQTLELGNSVAEFDNQLGNYFLETQPFRQLVSDQKDIVAGDKGTGKTAIFRILHSRYSQIPELRNIVVIPAFNPTGSPIFQQLAEHGVLEEGEYNSLWKAFILSLVGNWLLRHNRVRPKSNLAKLDELLKGLHLKSESDSPIPVFQRLLHKVGAAFRWKSAQTEFKVTPEGAFSFTPKVEFDAQKDEQAIGSDVSVGAALGLLNQCLAEVGKTVWVALDRLDEAFQGYPEIEIPALRALLRTYLDFTAFDRVKLKLFVRRDLFRRIIEGGFVNLTHVNARKVDVIWDEEDLLSLLCRRIRQNNDFIKHLPAGKYTDRELFYQVFAQKVDQGTRKPETWVWIMGRIRDGNSIRPPRNLIDLVSFAKEAQLRREDRDPQEYQSGRAIIEADALRRALTQLSEQRVNDTLLAEARIHAPLIELFRKGKAEHNVQSLRDLLGGAEGEIKERVRPLVALGFLEETGGNYKIPMLYRAGLEITQGKAFEEGVGSDSDDDE